MADAFKMMSKGGGKGFAQMAQMLGGMGGPGGDRLKNLGGGKMPMPSEKEIEEMAAKLQAGDGGFKLPGLGGGGLPGFNPFKK
jgi:signal recognition particle subunit SRP54